MNITRLYSKCEASNVVLPVNEKEKTYLTTQQKQRLLVQRQKIIKHEYFEDFHKEFKNYIQHLHQEFDQSYKNKSSTSRLFLVNDITKSTQTIQCLYTSKMKKVRLHVRANCPFFDIESCSQETLPKDIEIDQKYPNCITTPLWKLVYAFDRQLLRDASNLKYDKNKSVYEVFNVLNIHEESNKKLQKIIYNFINPKMFDIGNHLMNILNSKTTRIIMIVDRKQMVTNKGVLTNKSIVGLILFGGHDKYGYVIDYLAINYNKRYNSFGPLLINLSQLTSSKIMQRITDSHKSLRKKIIYDAYLGCREEVVGFYSSLGFSVLKDLSVLDKNRYLSYVGDRIDYCNWKNSSKLEDRYIVCQIDDICYRYINRVSLSKFIAEDLLYDKDIQKEYSNVLPPDNIKRAFINVIERYSNSTLYTPIRQTHLENVKDVITTNDSIFNEIMNNSFAPIPIGKLFYQSVEDYKLTKSKRRSVKLGISSLMIESFLNCTIFLYPPSEMGVEGVTLHQAPCWFCMSCSLCGKSIFFKKDTPREKYDYYMTKMILSLWTIHIFSLEIDNLDEHQLVNKGWNKCEKREYEHYEKLRSAQVKDEALGEVELDNAYVSFTKCLQMFFSIFHENYSGILKNITVYSIDLRLQKVKEEKLRRIKESRKTLRTNIVQEQTMEQGMPAGEQKNTDTSINNNDTESNSLPGESILFGNDPGGNTNKKNEHKNKDKDLTKPKKKKRKKGKPRRKKMSQPYTSGANKGHKGNKDDDTDHEDKDDEEYIDSDNDNDNDKNKDKDEDDLPINELVKRRQSKNLPDGITQKDLLQIQVNTDLENQRQEEELVWDEMAKADFLLQEKASGIEFVDVKKCTTLNPTSQIYIEKFKKMKEKEKIHMMELDSDEEEEEDEENLKEILKNENHYLLHTDDGECAVISSRWFEIDQGEWQNFDKRRISQRTVDKCLKEPNKIHNLTKQEKKWIRKTCKIMNVTAQVHKIKRLPDENHNAYFYETIFQGKLIRTRVKYVGIDMLNQTSYLEDQWLKINFNKPETQIIWNNIINLKANEIYELPIGSSGNDPDKIFIPEKDRGTILKYQQTKHNECLIYSICCVMSYLNQDNVCFYMLRLKRELEIQQQMCNMDDILCVLTNKHRRKGEQRLKKFIKKVKVINTQQILNDADNEKIYHCLLENHHAVTLYKQWIFDPIFPFCLRRNEHYLRLCAEMEPQQDSSMAIYKAYYYTVIEPK